MIRRSRPRGSSRLRTRPLFVDRLEARQLLTSAAVAYPSFVAVPFAGGGPPAGAFTPAQIRQAYGFNGVSFSGVQGDGTGETIAIVDAQDDPNIQADLNSFDTQFSLPATTVTRVNQAGGTSYPATDSTGGWELEESLDVEWAHAIAPGAKIMLVEANSANDTDLLAGVTYAAAHANVVSMSWGGGEFSGENADDGDFSHAGVAFVASSGDNGAPISWPAASPNVLAVGGTTLTLGTGSAWSSESAWSGSGGGPSAYESQPSYQAGVVTQTTKRANPDVAYDANPSTGFAVSDSVAYNGTVYGWLQIGGTSAGAPQWSALLAIADQGRAAGGLPALDAASPQEVMTTLYKDATSGDFHDVTTGTSTGTTHYSAAAGYDFTTGIGSPEANLVIPALVGTPKAPVDHLAIGAPTSAVAGTTIGVTVTAQGTAGTTDTAYVGTVKLSSTDVQAGLPASYTFTSADKGTHTFSVTLKTAATESITASDTTTGATAATDSNIVVSPAAASKFVLAGLPSSTTAGLSATFTVTAMDPYGNVASGYLGTVQFSSTDVKATLPGSYTFAANDKGVHSFSATFATAGAQSITATATGLTSASASTSVSPAAPISLKAVAASSSQINLSWSAASGDTSYLVQRSANGSTGWTQIGTTSGATTYSDTGLTAGTTYSYRVQGVGSGIGSSYSNTASVATTGSAPVTTTDSLWNSTYVPSINAYSSGSYEVGVKFHSDVAGTVTGVRFFKQTWMSGATHVGHLWSSTGALLATATFTGETASGWEQVNFASPISIAANTTYVVSFSTGGGYFSATTSFFTGAGVDNGPLHAPADGASGSDGVYNSPGAFPSIGDSGINFWVDVAFSPTSSASHASSTTTRPVSGGTSTAFAAIAPPSSNLGSTNAGSSSQHETSTSSQSTRSLPSQTASWPYRSTVPQTLGFSARPRGFFA